MFSSKPTAVLLLKAKGLEFYSAKEEEREILEFPPSILKKQEIVEWEKFEEIVESFLARNSLGKQRAVMILSQDVLFEKVFPIPEDEKKEEGQEEKFFKEIPYKKEEVVTKRLKDDKNIYLIATHKDFYQSVRYTLEKFGWKIERIVPVTLFDGMEKEKTLSLDEVKQIISYVSSLKIGDFLTDANAADDFKKQETAVQDEPSKATPIPDTSKPKSGSRNIFFFFGIVVVIALVGFGLLSTHMISIPWGLLGMKDITATPTPTPAPTATPTPTPVPLGKEEVTVKVLNGTGTVGQAGKVKSALSSFGFKSIDTDNADTTDATETSVVFVPGVPKEIKTEILDALKKLFTSVTSKDEENGSSAVVITTGTEK